MNNWKKVRVAFYIAEGNDNEHVWILFNNFLLNYDIYVMFLFYLYFLIIFCFTKIKQKIEKINDLRNWASDKCVILKDLLNLISERLFLF